MEAAAIDRLKAVEQQADKAAISRSEMLRRFSISVFTGSVLENALTTNPPRLRSRVPRQKTGFHAGHLRGRRMSTS